MGRAWATWMTAGVLIAGIGAAEPAEAQLVAPAVHEARLALSEYDLEGDRTVRVIKDLTEFIRDADHGPDLREARFLRAVVTADLLLLSRLSDDRGARKLPHRLAEALSVSLDRLVPFVRTELERVKSRVYAPVVRDVHDGLVLIDRYEAGTTVDWTKYRGLRRDVFLLRSVSQALASSDRPLALLTRLGHDPCAEPLVAEATSAEGTEIAAAEATPKPAAQSACPPLFAAFAPEGRKAVAAFVEAADALQRVTQARSGGDPFSAHLSRLTDRAQTILSQVRIHPAPALPKGWSPTSVPFSNDGERPELMALVVPQGLRVSRVPAIGYSETRGVGAVEEGDGILPGDALFPVNWPREAAAVPALQSQLKAAFGDGSRRIVLGAVDGILTHDVESALRSLSGAGLTPAGFIAGSPSQAVRVLPANFLFGASASEAPKAQYRLRAWPGGYMVASANGLQGVPRLGSERAFDAASLQRVVNQPSTVSLTFFRALPWESLAIVAGNLRPSDGPVVVLLP